MPELVVGRQVWTRGTVQDAVAAVGAAGLEPMDVADIAAGLWRPCCSRAWE